MSNTWSNHELLTKPQDFDIATTESIPFSWDVSVFVGDGETISLPSARIDRMVSKDTGVLVTPDPVIGTPSIVGNVVIVTIDGSKLKQDELYRVVVSVNIGPNKRQSCITMLRCVG
jgi:hypothetical protein